MNENSRPIDFLINRVHQPKAQLILAHGAGAAMDSPFMSTIADSLASSDIEIWRFEFPYMRERRETGSKRPPNRQNELILCWQQVLDQVSIRAPLFIGGKSMGGRIASMIADESTIQGLICLGYPFHPTGKPDKLRTEHLQQLATATLILQGERDSLGNRDEVSRYPLAKTIQLAWLPDGDHSFKPRKKSGFTIDQNMGKAIDLIHEFIINKRS